MRRVFVGSKVGWIFLCVEKSLLGLFLLQNMCLVFPCAPLPVGCFSCNIFVLPHVLSSISDFTLLGLEHFSDK